VTESGAKPPRTHVVLVHPEVSLEHRKRRADGIRSFGLPGDRVVAALKKYNRMKQ